MLVTRLRSLASDGWYSGFKNMRRIAWYLIAIFISITFLLAVATSTSLRPVPVLSTVTDDIFKPQLLDRNGIPLTVTYQNRWNIHNQVMLYEVPLLLQKAFVISEDQHFFSHNGVDWIARLHAAWQNLIAMDSVRGASTISEQVVRMLHLRKRTFWARWLEGFEARQLETKNSKAYILEFYINQVPYAAQRRGIAQAANYYFNRDLSTLTDKELLALVIMVRAPGRFNVHESVAPVQNRIMLLAERLRENALLGKKAFNRLTAQSLRAAYGDSPVQANHFARFVYENVPVDLPYIETTLDATLQYSAQRILDQRLEYLQDRNIDNAGLLVVDHRNNEILAWVIGGSSGYTNSSFNIFATEYDAVLSPRQPGSTLKPFVYALALNKGWTAATMIDDSPLSQPVGHGLHTYHNYSRIHYGSVSLREALGNSLNIPAVRAMQFVGAESLLDTFHDLGIQSLDRHPDYYGDGLALGNGELTLFELVQAYTTLARAGVFTPLIATRSQSEYRIQRVVFDEQIATLIGSILSDSEARRLEFGDGGLLDFPMQTAVKTGTSSDYRDAWAVGYNYRFTVGVWMGNLRGNPMGEVTGSTGPALVLRSIFAELTRNHPSKPLQISPLLVKQRVCVETGLPVKHDCAQRKEWFVSTTPVQIENEAIRPLWIRQPYTGLQMARDPRIPDHIEAFEFKLSHQQNIEQVQWFLNNKLIAESNQPNYTWSLEEGNHTLLAKARYLDSKEWIETPLVRFAVK